ncbi:MAG: lactonase family protein [Pyrinomonadaceae bacterium]|nr:lactonase family protein [Sphingobacteriaceae bacterium]
MNHSKFSCCLVLLFLMLTESQAQKLNLLIGTYTKPGKSEGIYVYDFDVATGKASYKNKAAGLNNPSYLALSKNQNFVYAVTEAGPGKGTVSAFTFDKKSGDLTLLNSKPSGGDGPCYVSIDKKSQHVFVANYSGGSFSAIPILKDGSLKEPVQTVTFIANGTGNGQQAKPHAHSTVLSPDEKYVYVSDLGNDEILGYKYSGSAPKPLAVWHTIKLPKGSGPRHFTFHPNKKFGYSVQELSCDVVAYSYKKGKLTFLQSISSLANGYTGRKWSADIHISPDGKFLYSSNRDDANEIAIFSIQKDGRLTLVGRQTTLGKAPRNFVIDPTGNYLLAANQNSDSIIIFKRDHVTGLLSNTGEKIELSAPVCLKFAEGE